jgi:hypothetical protein
VPHLIAWRYDYPEWPSVPVAPCSCKHSPAPGITPRAGVFGQFDITSIFAGPFEAGSGANVMTVDVSALSLTLWIASALVTEVMPDGTPHSGAATYRIWSVQLFSMPRDRVMPDAA